MSLAGLRGEAIGAPCGAEGQAPPAIASPLLRTRPGGVASAPERQVRKGWDRAKGLAAVQAANLFKRRRGRLGM
jgi:hypothetical protein